MFEDFKTVKSLYELCDFCKNWLECFGESHGSRSISKVNTKAFKRFARIFGKLLKARVSAEDSSR